VETRTAGSASGLGKRTSSNAGTAPQADSTVPSRRHASCRRYRTLFAWRPHQAMSEGADGRFGARPVMTGPRRGSLNQHLGHPNLVRSLPCIH
jgi:hypothetical protein